ncbi:deoxynucleoside kinase [Bacteroidia bacterium]|nr:deoxynucleoside kinase [Bacteroidia bacterium]
MHIAIAGNIGSGKTTLTQLLAQHYKWQPLYEDTADNPYLSDFYNDMSRWSFHLQMYFLGKRFKQIVEIRQLPQTIVQDRTVFEDAQIFAANLHDMGLLSPNDFATYMSLYNLLNSLVTPPHLLIYLRMPVPALVEQIYKRGREYEASIRIDYLKNLNEKYELWISNYKHRKLIIDMAKINFVDNPQHLSTITKLIDTELKTLR